MDMPSLVGVAAQVAAWLILLGSLFYAVTILRVMAGTLKSIDENMVITAAVMEGPQRPDPPPPAPERPQPANDEPRLSEE